MASLPARSLSLLAAAVLALAPSARAAEAPEDIRFKVEKLLEGMPQPMHLEFGPDGRIYFTIGDRGYRVEHDGGIDHDPGSGAVFRCEPDGSHLEVFARGMRNPQELAFDDLGNLFTSVSARRLPRRRGRQFDPQLPRETVRRHVCRVRQGADDPQRVGHRRRGRT